MRRGSYNDPQCMHTESPVPAFEDIPPPKFQALHSSHFAAAAFAIGILKND